MGREWLSLRVGPETVAYARKVAAENDETVSAVLRRLLALGGAAHQGKPGSSGVSPSPAPAQQATARTAAARPDSSPCRRCPDCRGYNANPRRTLTCVCGHSLGDHPHPR